MGLFVVAAAVFLILILGRPFKSGVEMRGGGMSGAQLAGLVGLGLTTMFLMYA